jgi:uncharacterized protein YegL
VSASLRRFIANIVFVMTAAGGGAEGLRAGEAPPDELPPCGPIDLVLVIDDSGSMTRAIDDVKARMAEILDLVDELSGGTFQLGLVTFGARVRVREDLDDVPDPATKKAAMIEALRHISALGGGRGPEASDEALNTVVNRLPAAGRLQRGDFNGHFRGESRIVILITDQLPAGFDDVYTEGLDDLNLLRLAEQAAARNIRISTIPVPLRTMAPAVQGQLAGLMLAVSQVTGGVNVPRVDARGGTSAAILDIVRACGRLTLSLREDRRYVAVASR